MDGQYLNNAKTTLQYLQLWSESVNESTDSWMANYVYLDEIKGLSNVKRENWITESIKVFNVIVKRFNFNSNNIPCLRIALKMKRRNIDVKNVSLEWLQKNLDEFTPPSFFYSSLDYYKGYYSSQLSKCITDNENLSEIQNCEIYYYNRFDDLENGFIRDIYIFKV